MTEGKVQIGIEREGKTLVLALRSPDGCATLSCQARGAVSLAAAIDRVARAETDAELAVTGELEVSGA